MRYGWQNWLRIEEGYRDRMCGHHMMTIIKHHERFTFSKGWSASWWWLRISWLLSICMYVWRCVDIRRGKMNEILVVERSGEMSWGWKEGRKMRRVECVGNPIMTRQLLLRRMNPFFSSSFHVLCPKEDLTSIDSRFSLLILFCVVRVLGSEQY